MCCRNAIEARKRALEHCGRVHTGTHATCRRWFICVLRALSVRPSLTILVEEKGDRIFPVFILNEMPVGMKGLLIAGVLSAAISSLDSILAALSQISVTMFYRPFVKPDERRYITSQSQECSLSFGDCS